MVDYKFNDIIQNISTWNIKDGWITIYRNLDKSKYCDQGAIFCGIVSNKALKNSLESYGWDLLIGQCRPGHVRYYNNGKEKIEYYRFSNDGIEPFVLHRNEFGYRKGYIELSEEFRLYYNLYEETTKNGKIFIQIDDNGDDIPVAKIENDIVQVKLNFLKDYINSRKVNFAIYFDLMRFSNDTLVSLNLAEQNDTVSKTNYVYNLLIRDMSDMLIGENKTQAWLLGKIILFYDKKHKVKMYGSINNDDEQYVDYIIGFDESGKCIEHTSNEQFLANYFGKNPGSPHYLTPVYFKNDVLKKYYDNPTKYSVRDGIIECNGSWSLRLDNSCRDYIIVFLGDLGKLSYKEQLYWKSFNIEKQEGLSRTGFKRAFLGEPADPDNPDLYFKMRLRQFNEKWSKKYGWNLFKQLNEKDEHYFKSLHCLTTDDNAKEFDEQVLNLTKIIIDSLNEKELQRDITIETNDKGIDKFEKYLLSKGFNYTEMITFIKNLQNLRSTTVAHRRSDSNKKSKDTLEYFNIGNDSLKNVFDEILIKTIMIFNTLEKAFSL